MMVMGLSSHAQDSNNPWLYPWVNAADTKTRAGGVTKQTFSQPCCKRQLEYSSIYFSVSKYIEIISLWLAGSVNKIDNMLYFLQVPGSDSRGYLVSNPWFNVLWCWCYC
jgi:hypothetical protein